MRSAIQILPFTIYHLPPMTDAYNSVIDYRRYIAEQARDFYGRAAVLRALDAWLLAEGPRFFAIIGPPGSGKTAIAARAAQFALGELPPPQHAPNLQPHFLSAMHFCPTADLRWMSDRRWFHPKVFAESLSRQLAAHYSTFAKALVDQASNGRITINSSQMVDTNNGTVIGVQIQQLGISNLSVEDAFNYAVREPLETLLRSDPNLRIVLLVDALDEAQRYDRQPNIVSLITQTGSLSPRARFVVTARPGVAGLEELAENGEAAVHRLDEEPYLSESLTDIRALFLERASAAHLEQRLHGVTLDELADRVSDRSKGNFLYATQIGDMLQSQAEISATVLDELPRGLTAFYRAFLKQTIEQSKLAWETRLRPTLGAMAVAQEALRRSPLAAVAKQAEPKMIPVLRSVRPVLDQDDELAETQRTYSFYHRSFADFLLDPDDAEEYWCEVAEQHERLARFCQRHVDQGLYPYARRYLSLHLAEAALGREQPARHTHTSTLVALVLSPDFEALRVREDGAGAFRDDLRRTLRTVAVNAHQDAPGLVLAIAAASLAFQADYLTPAPIIALAQKGQLTEAARLLALMPIESKWQQVAILSLVWLAIGSGPNQLNHAARGDAEALFAQVAESSFLPSPIPELMRIVDAALYGRPFPQLAPLPQAPDEQTARDLVERLGGAGIEPLNVTERINEYTYSLGPNQTNTGMGLGRDSDSIFVAAQDGPLLVAYAVQHDIMLESNKSLIDQYIGLQAANKYVRYRNGSLWVLLDAVLRHNDPLWIRERVVQLVSGALAGSRIEFQESLPLALLALRATFGGKTHAYDRLAQHAEARAAACATDREQNDTIGSHTRRLAALAHMYAAVVNEPARAIALIDIVLDPHIRGYAGLYAPAALALAEAIFLVQPTDQHRIGLALNKARRSAHRVQDSAFCAQTTARWNALIDRWWSRPLDGAALQQTVRDLHANPTHVRFTAQHNLGEGYNERPRDDQDQLPIAFWVANAQTLAELAEVYERPLAEFERVNPGGIAATVNVPDPQFTPLLAAYLSAAVLASPELPPARKVELIQLLVPVAVHNPTALDTVLARLILAAHSAGWINQAVLKQLAGVAYPGSLPVLV